MAIQTAKVPRSVRNRATSAGSSSTPGPLPVVLGCLLKLEMTSFTTSVGPPPATAAPAVRARTPVATTPTVRRRLPRHHGAAAGPGCWGSARMSARVVADQAGSKASGTGLRAVIFSSVVIRNHLCSVSWQRRTSCGVLAGSSALRARCRRTRRVPLRTPRTVAASSGESPSQATRSSASRCWSGSRASASRAATRSVASIPASSAEQVAASRRTRRSCRATLRPAARRWLPMTLRAAPTSQAIGGCGTASHRRQAWRKVSATTSWTSAAATWRRT